MGVISEIMEISEVKIGYAKKPEFFVGRPYYLDYDKAYILITDAWKHKVGGIPQGTFLLAFYENENDQIEESILLRCLRPSALPTDNAVISSMVDYYKDNLKTSGSASQLDEYTKYTFSFSGLECRILGTFYRNKKGETAFGADIENFYSAHNYAVYKPPKDVLTKIVNFKDGKTSVGGNQDVKIGKVRYSSSLRFQEQTRDDVDVFINMQDILGKRSALFGMTRTGKSNTVKKIIDATTVISNKAKRTAFDLQNQSPNSLRVADNLNPFDESGNPKLKVGQIIFDINGEYANSNMQDEGTAIYDKYSDMTTRYSVIEKPGFKVLKINFYEQIESGFSLLRQYLENRTGDYLQSFLNIDLDEPEGEDPYGSGITRWRRRVAAYQCCLHKAGFKTPDGFRIYFDGKSEINEKVSEESNETIQPNSKNGIEIDKAVKWFEWLARNCNSDEDGIFSKYKKTKGKDYVDEDLRSILVMLSRSRKLDGTINLSGYKLLDPLCKLHTDSTDSFEKDILNGLREGSIQIIDLSQGDPQIQSTYSERICRLIFQDSMDNFTNNKENNFIQFYFEEAHNLFPKKDDKDLSQIYNRIAKEGAKLNLGMIYATQEVSSISSNILKNTQNWFIAHLNNDDEIREIRKYYDFSDFCDSLIRYSASIDRGFIRMKTYSNAFVVPVQIDRFTSGDKK